MPESTILYLQVFRAACYQFSTTAKASPTEKPALGGLGVLKEPLCIALVDWFRGDTSRWASERRKDAQWGIPSRSALDIGDGR